MTAPGLALSSLPALPLPLACRSHFSLPLPAGMGCVMCVRCDVREMCDDVCGVCAARMSLSCVAGRSQRGTDRIGSHPSLGSLDRRGTAHDQTVCHLRMFCAAAMGMRL
jgi:hypothetical protein